jgi:hypothetical protein
MGNLTVALAGLAGVVLAGVVAHGAWSARKAAVRREASNAPDAGPREPVFVAEPPSEAATPVEPRSVRRAAPRLDALIDALAALALDAPITGELAIAHLPATRRAGSKPFLVEGLNAASGDWEPPQPQQRYGEFQAGVQMVNRTGALFADAIGATPDFPDMLDVVARARELDAFASEHDVQLAVHLRARSSAWSVGYLQQHAGRHGFVPGLVPGRLVLPGSEEGAPPMLVLSFDAAAALADDPGKAALRDVTLGFDVPQTEAVADPFTHWQASAQALALGMDAAIVDDSGRPLTTPGFAAIGAELGRIYAALQARDLAAGSAAARRLFS